MDNSVKQILLLLLVTLLYGGTASLDDANQCQFSAYENEESILEAKAKIRPLVGHTYKSSDTVDGTVYSYTVAICSSAVPNDATYKDAAVVQTEKVLDDFKIRNVGSLTNVHIMSGTDWVYLEYKDGDKYGSHCTNEPKRTIVIITCDPDVGDAEARMVFVEEQKQKKEACFYLFEMKHKAVCPVGASSGGLSVGSILLIVFFTVAGVYLLVGFLYSRFVLGNKGMAQIPNYEFWQDFGNLTADGCDLVCRSGSGRGHSGQLGGIGDAQLDDEIVRDENLLPM